MHLASTLEISASRENVEHVSTWVIVVDPDPNVTLTTCCAGAIVVEEDGMNSSRNTLVVLPVPPDEPLDNDSANCPLLNTVPLVDVEPSHPGPPPHAVALNGEAETYPQLANGVSGERDVTTTP